MSKFLCSILTALFSFATVLSQLVQTRLGPVQGKTETVDGKNYAVFLSIPYAEPPIGHLRFQDTVPKKPWGPPGILYADAKFSKKCPQHGGPFDADSQSEDCLYLNIFTPAANAKNLPVMVWIHGGAFVGTSASEFPVEGILRNFVSHNVVFVSINYRIGILGFWNLHSSVAGGNYGFFDQIEALKWIKTYIGNFGGDFEKITVFGESAGAASASLLTMSPLSKGLFNQAIMQSASGLAPWVIKRDSDIDDSSKRVWEYLGCGGQSSEVTRYGYRQHEPYRARLREVAILKCMQSQPVSEIIRAQNEILPLSGYLAWTGRVDGRFLPEDPEKLAKKRPSINVMIGCTKNEYSLFEFIGGLNGNPGPSRTPADIGRVFPDYLIPDLFSNIPALEAAAEYKFINSVKFQAASAKYPGDFWLDQAIALKSGVLFLAPSYKDAVYFANSGSNVYLYSLDYTAPNTNLFKGITWKGVGHLTDVFYQFFSGGGSVSPEDGVTQAQVLLLMPSPETPTDRQVAEFIHKTWTDFAKFGNPTPQPVDGAVWERFDADLSNYMSIDMPPVMLQGFNTEDVLFWNELVPKLEQSNRVCRKITKLTLQ